MKYFMIIAWGECPFCVKAKALVLERGFECEYIVLDHAPSLLENYKKSYNMKTVPIVICHDTETQHERIIGGYTDLVKFFEEEA